MLTVTIKGGPRKQREALRGFIFKKLDELWFPRIPDCTGEVMKEINSVAAQDFADALPDDVDIVVRVEQ